MSKSQQIKEEYAYLVRKFNAETDSFKAEEILRKIDALYGSEQDENSNVGGDK